MLSMKAPLSAIAVALSAMACMPALAAPPARERTDAALMQVEQEWLAALKRRDVDALARILGEDFIDSGFQGDAVTRAQYLGFFARPETEPAPPFRQTFDGARVRFVAGGEVAIVTGVVISSPQSPAPGDREAIRHSRFTDVFVWRDGRWQAVSAQETRFTPRKDR